MGECGQMKRQGCRQHAETVRDDARRETFGPDRHEQPEQVEPGFLGQRPERADRSFLFRRPEPFVIWTIVKITAENRKSTTFCQISNLKPHIAANFAKILCHSASNHGFGDRG